MTLLLDGAAVTDRADLHRRLAAGLDLPDWYGQNLDALYDCLTDLPRDTVLHVTNGALLRRRLEGYADALHRVLQISAGENPRLTLIWEESAQ